MPYWRLKRFRKSERFWRDLPKRPESERRAFQTAEETLTENPYPLGKASGIVYHFSGTLLCNHEYRKLPNAQRIFYKIVPRSELEKRAIANGETMTWDDEECLGEVHIFYTGPHPHGKEYERILPP